MDNDPPVNQQPIEEVQEHTGAIIPSRDDLFGIVDGEFRRFKANLVGSGGSSGARVSTAVFDPSTNHISITYTDTSISPLSVDLSTLAAGKIASATLDSDTHVLTITRGGGASPITVDLSSLAGGGGGSGDILTWVLPQAATFIDTGLTYLPNWDHIQIRHGANRATLYLPGSRLSTFTKASVGDTPTRQTQRGIWRIIDGRTAIFAVFGLSSDNKLLLALAPANYIARNPAPTSDLTIINPSITAFERTAQSNLNADIVLNTNTQYVATGITLNTAWNAVILSSNNGISANVSLDNLSTVRPAAAGDIPTQANQMASLFASDFTNNINYYVSAAKTARNELLLAITPAALLNDPGYSSPTANLTLSQPINVQAELSLGDVTPGGDGGGTTGGSGASILEGTTAPTAAQGSNGDFYIQKDNDNHTLELFIKAGGAWGFVASVPQNGNLQIVLSEIRTQLAALQAASETIPGTQTFNEMIAEPSEDVRVYDATNLAEAVATRDTIDGDYHLVLREISNLNLRRNVDISSVRIYAVGSDLSTTELHRENWTVLQDRRIINFNISDAEKTGAAGKIQRADGRNFYHIRVAFYVGANEADSRTATLWIVGNNRLKTPASSETASTIRDKLASLGGNNRLNKSAVNGLDNFDNLVDEQSVLKAKTEEIRLLHAELTWATAPIAEAGIRLYATADRIGAGLKNNSRDYDASTDAGADNLWAAEIADQDDNTEYALVARIHKDNDLARYRWLVGVANSAIHPYERVDTKDPWLYYYFGNITDSAVAVQKRGEAPATEFSGQLAGRALRQVQESGSAETTKSILSKGIINAYNGVYGKLTAGNRTPFAGYTYTGYSTPGGALPSVGSVEGTTSRTLIGIYTATVKTNPAPQLAQVIEGKTYVAVDPAVGVPLYMIVDGVSYALSDVINNQYYEVQGIADQFFVNEAVHDVQVIFNDGTAWITKSPVASGGGDGVTAVLSVSPSVWRKATGATSILINLWSSHDNATTVDFVVGSNKFNGRAYTGGFQEFAIALTANQADNITNAAGNIVITANIKDTDGNSLETTQIRLGRDDVASLVNELFSTTKTRLGNGSESIPFDVGNTRDTTGKQGSAIGASTFTITAGHAALAGKITADYEIANPNIYNNDAPFDVEIQMIRASDDSVVDFLNIASATEGKVEFDNQEAGDYKFAIRVRTSGRYSGTLRLTGTGIQSAVPAAQPAVREVMNAPLSDLAEHLQINIDTVDAKIGNLQSATRVRTAQDTTTRAFINASNPKVQFAPTVAENELIIEFAISRRILTLRLSTSQLQSVNTVYGLSARSGDPTITLRISNDGQHVIIENVTAADSIKIYAVGIAIGSS